ncbi:MAG: hypothetical protein F4Y24_13220 [Gemmatimonadetes bacterium]|nr:hypothetical protein [Gemmatimonadota bacterium]MYJ37878.1 hypothetical protein [Gemmatimonadota bacterium]
MGQMEYLHRRQAALGRDKQRESAPQPRDTEQGVPWLSPFRFRRIAVYGAFLLSPFLEACTDDTPTTPAAPDAAVQSAMGMTADSARVIIEPHWLTLEGTGATGTLTARVTDADGNEVASPQVTWASADATVATVSGAGSGVARVTAAGLGKTGVKATYNSVTAEATVEVALPLTDREILEVLYEATGGDGWTDNTNWLSNKDLSEWYGVGMSGDKVDDLRLYDNNLVGTIPPELGGLDELFILSLSDNKLSGPIPPELSKLTRLRDLLLYGNAEISGRLPPELGYTGGLEYLSTDGTNLNGPVPLTFANLELTHFYFDRDDLCIPAGLEAWLKTVPEATDDYSICTDQITVDPGSLYFEGPPLGDTARLTAEVITAEGYTMHDAKITWSSADTTIAKVDSAGLVTAVDYGTTQVTATSDALTATAEVQVVLTLTDRQVLDSIHQLMGGENWTDTTNWLSDEPLSEWYGVETNGVGKVVGLSLANNGLAGPMPDMLAELGDLVTLDLSGNALSGEIPRELEELARLHTLVLNDNALEGRLPASMGSLAALRYLHIGTNELSGVVPRSFRQLALDTLYTAGSGVCVPPSLNEWVAEIEQTDDADRCMASLAIRVVDLPSLTFYAVGETVTLSATYVDAEGDSTYEASVTWSTGDATVASVDVRGKVTAVGNGTTEVTATHNTVTESIAVEVALPETDRDVLGILYDRTRGAAWTDGADWLSDEPLSEWAGVETDENGRVTGLSLAGNNLRGMIHSSIGQLDQLVTLDLSRNWITGPIPAEIGHLSRLRDLALSVNGFSSRLPSGLGALASLRNLNVAATSLSGLVPASFAALELDSFLVGGTELCVPPSLATWLGAIPQKDSPPECAARVSVEPSTLTFGAAGQTAQLSVTVVDAEGNVVGSPEVTWETTDRLVATVDPTGLVTARAAGITAVAATYESVTAGSAEVAVSLPGSDRAALEALYHATRGDDWKDNTNWLSDEPLEEWYGVDVADGRVDHLNLGKNNLDGQIPAAIGLLDHLFILDLNGNAIAGSIPPAIGRLQSLRDLTLRDTGLEGSVPPEIGNMTRLEYLSFTNTNLTGPLPETFAHLKLDQFYHSRTGLCVPRSLAAWYETLGNSDPLPCIPETADREVLTTLHDETGGTEWRRDRNWLTDKGLNTWRGIETDEEGYVTEIFLPWNRLTGSIPPELGNLARLEVLGLYGNDLTGRIPPELGKLDRVRVLLLSSNELEGPIPPEIGGMVSVDTMYLAGNDLSGPIPPEFGNLVSLEHLALFENDLSGPLPAEFGKLKKLKSAWLVDNDFEGPLPPELGDMTSLEDLSLSRNKITGTLPPELGNLQNLKELGLGDNELTGPIPPELGNMTSLEGLFLMRNQLSGGIPPELGKLSDLETLWIFDNEFTGPIPAELGELSSLKDLSISTNGLTGSIPPELGRLSALEGMFLMRNNLTGTIPPELGNLSNLETLWLFRNELSGAIPAELGNLSALEDLTLGDNRLTGSIPPELGKLSSLKYLGARNNNLGGPIPGELGQLTSLLGLSLRENNLSGHLPPELGGLISLEELNVHGNPDLGGLMPRGMLNLPLDYLDISDTWICPQRDDEFQEWLNGISRAYGLQCPPTLTERFALAGFYAAAGGDSWISRRGWGTDSALGNWHGVTVSSRDTLVRRLVLSDNGLRGSLASAIGNLTKLETLDLGNNSLTGGIPVAVTSIEALDTIRISGNEGLEGPLPFQMTQMTELKALYYGDTGMCASPSTTFQKWFDGLDQAEGAVCDNAEAVKLSLPVVYLTQAIQRPAGDVPLLSGREALLRVFLVGDQTNAFFEPEVVATLTRDGEVVHRVVMRTADDRLSTAADEGVLGTSYNAVISAEHVVPGTELVVVADPAETVPRAAGSRTRFPEAGAMPLNVIDVPPFKLTVVPVLNAANPDTSIFAWTDSISDDSPQVGLLRYSFPFAEFSAMTRESYVTSLDLTDEDNTWPLVLELEAVYQADEATGYWYAVADSDQGYVRGIARLNGWVSFGKPWDTELAHEVGHTLDLKHAPCGGAGGVEPDFPYPNGGIGMWGYDFRDGSAVSPNSRRDIMGYCYEKGWLSDYYYEKVIRVREKKEGGGARPPMAGAGPKSQMLVLWGGVFGDELRIEPVLSMYTTAKLPERPGPYRLEGIADEGQTEFSLSFTPGEDKYGNKYFFFTIPIEEDWEGSLERIVLTGPEGEVTVDDSDPRSISVFTDPSTGRIRSILRDWDGPAVAAMGATDPLQVVTTRGIREAVTLRPRR